MSTNPKLSIIIPCYNHGEFLEETIRSAEQCPKELCEIIIIDDGSTDGGTLKIFERLRLEGYNVIRQENKGVGAARNHGISLAKGEYILPLDSDNKIRATFVQHAVEALDANPDVGIVHGNFQYFGELDYTHIVPDFNITRMLFMNFIDTCAIYRKRVWEDNGGYDADMPVQGIEDWDFWINAHAHGWKFLKLNEIAFDYRARKGSMLDNLKREENYTISLEYLFKKYAMLMKNEYDQLYKWEFHGRQFRRQPVRTMFRLVSSAWFPKLHARIYYR